ncbi:hypothetical protein FQV27_06215 [Paracoccus aurantiacus]|uniref:Uncharacterized protein n=1 Tax=Paracoccus aurantiacus TaxID=2599412 RepID=A0A5C6S7H1_9RHOB|nr:hypothetical protein [Paracoccus aurantiacus]TXB69712.1 hypothetical protein FQV27_06215 [Paracoccus aurantiacus]
MAGEINPIATHHIPGFITAPGQTDVFLVGIGIFLLVVIFLLGIAFLWLHSLPERMAHKSQKLQFEVVAVLCLLALFTHNNLLWGIALLLAMIDLPDLATPLGRISDALERMVQPRRNVVVTPDDTPPAPNPPQAADPSADSKTGE